MDTKRAAHAFCFAILVAATFAGCGGKSAATPVTWTLDTPWAPYTGGSVSVDRPDLHNASAGQSIYYYDCTATADLVIKATAVPSQGYQFDHWEADCSGTAATATVTFPHDTGDCSSTLETKTCRALFVPVATADSGVVD